MSYRILITGSRNWTDRQVIEDALAAVDAFGLPASEVTIIHGAAPGADTLADDIAEEYRFITEPHPADWAKHGKAAGPRRNTEMVDAGADVCLAFLHPDSRGTVDCSNKAENAGIPVFRFYEGLRGNKMIAQDILSIPMEDNDADASTVGEYLARLLSEVWRWDEEFNGKRPFGNSGWKWDIYTALVSAGVVAGVIDEDGWLEEFEAEREADTLIQEAITKMGGGKSNG